MTTDVSTTLTKELVHTYLSKLFYRVKDNRVYRFKSYILMACSMIFSLICVKLVYALFMFTFPLFVVALILRYLVNYNPHEKEKNFETTTDMVEYLVVLYLLNVLNLLTFIPYTESPIRMISILIGLVSIADDDMRQRICSRVRLLVVRVNETVKVDSTADSSAAADSTAAADSAQPIMQPTKLSVYLNYGIEFVKSSCKSVYRYAKNPLNIYRAVLELDRAIGQSIDQLVFDQLSPEEQENARKVKPVVEPEQAAEPVEQESADKAEESDDSLDE